eukprot:UN24596
MFKYISENEFLPPERNLLDTEKIKELTLGLSIRKSRFSSLNELKSFQDSQYELYCRNASHRALHCIRESIFRNANLEKSHPGEYLRHILKEETSRGQIVGVVCAMLYQTRDQSEAPVELKILEYFIRLSLKLDADARISTHRWLKQFQMLWQMNRPKDKKLCEDLIGYFNEGNDAEITRIIEGM